MTAYNGGMNPRIDPRRIEAVDLVVAAILRAKAPYERVAMMAQAHRTARLLLRAQMMRMNPDWTEDEYPWVVGRKRFGRITIANSDAEGVCLTQAAFDQAHRAVDELMSRRVAWWNRV